MSDWVKGEGVESPAPPEVHPLLRPVLQERLLSLANLARESGDRSLAAALVMLRLSRVQKAESSELDMASLLTADQISNLKNLAKAWRLTADICRRRAYESGGVGGSVAAPVFAGRSDAYQNASETLALYAELCEPDGLEMVLKSLNYESDV